MLKRVKIQGYKSLADVEVELQPLTVLFGPNAAGKSNFLDALQLLSRIATSKDLKEAFSPPYRGLPLESFTFGSSGIEGLMAQGKATFSIEVDVELSQVVVDAVNDQIREVGGPKTSGYVHEKYLRYGITVEILPNTGVLRMASEHLVALSTDGEPVKKNPFLEWKGNGRYLHTEGRVPYRLEHLSHSILSRSLYPDISPHLVAMQKELESWYFFYLEPRERMRLSAPVREVRHIGLMGEELSAFLNTLQALDKPQFEAVEKALHVFIPSITGIDVSVNNLGEVDLKLMQGQTPIPVRVVSEGTLRLLGLLALGGAKEPSTLLGFEEPETGIAPDRLDLIAILLQNLMGDDTQVIVTTHSPALLDLIPAEFLYAVRQMKGHTSIVPLSSLPAKGQKSKETPLSERVLRGEFNASY